MDSLVTRFRAGALRSHQMSALVKVHNSDSWDVVELTEKNIEQYVTIEGLIPEYASNKINRIALSEIIRIELLKTYGGLWIDATTFCNKPLDRWLPEYIDHGFFAFELQNDRLLSKHNVLSNCA